VLQYEHVIPRLIKLYEIGFEVSLTH
jgi:hypothetical protein